jgi:Na+-transporting methylmalonyl-CoA/oxaloacetate decarboxylase gamma subunit
MAENLNAALQITLVGMTFVLAALGLLWVMMAVLVRVTAEREPAETPAGVTAGAPPRDVQRRAAAAAVALALARLAESHPALPPARPAPNVSPWQAVMRARLMRQRERRR